MQSDLVMLAGQGRSTRIVFWTLDRVFGVERVILENSVSRRKLLRRRAEKLGMLTVLGQVAFQGLVQPLLQSRSEKRIREILDELELDDRPIPEHKIIRTESVNTEHARAELTRLNPRVVAINGTRILGKDTLTCVQSTFINMHAGITPHYRGVHGGYWALADQTPERCGVTVHLVDTGIDTGGILGQALIHPTEEDNFATYPFLQLAAGVGLLEKAIRNALDGKVEPMPSSPGGPSKLWYHPTIGQYLWNRARRGVK